jgi:tRNA nucleotidyltransferase (CCA-adding enzyme)
MAADPLAAGQLAVDGNDLVRELGRQPGPWLGRALGALLEAVLDDPSLNRREELLSLARRVASDDASGAGEQRQARRSEAASD